MAGTAVYEEYGKRRGTDSLTYLKDDRSMEMVNLKTGETRVIRSESDTGSEETDEISDICIDKRTACK